MIHQVVQKYKDFKGLEDGAVMPPLWKLGTRAKIELSYRQKLAKLKLAEAIVKYRTDNGPFKEWKDLTNVKGLDPKRVEEQQGNLDFGTQRFQPPSATSESRSSR